MTNDTTKTVAETKMFSIEWGHHAARKSMILQARSIAEARAMAKTLGAWGTVEVYEIPAQSDGR